MCDDNIFELFSKENKNLDMKNNAAVTLNELDCALLLL